jgi:hypothetical protein
MSFPCSRPSELVRTFHRTRYPDRANQVMRRIQIPVARLAILSTKKPCIREKIHAELPFEPVEPILGQCSGGEVRRRPLHGHETLRPRETLHESLVPLGGNGISKITSSHLKTKWNFSIYKIPNFISSTLSTDDPAFDQWPSRWKTLLSPI